MKPTEFISKLPKSLCLILCLALLVLIGFLDHITGEEISFSVFYLLPVSLATWRTNRWIGIFLCVLAAAIWLYVDIISGNAYSHITIPYWNAFVRLCFFLTVSILLTRLKTSFRHEKELSRTDSLTGLLNIRAFCDLASIEINRARRFKRPFTAAYIDVDNFKMVNDQFGHDIGNTLLISIAEAIKKNIRAVDLTARLGGDEFVVFWGETGGEAARSVLNKLQEQIMDLFDRNKWPVTLSIGAVTYTKPIDTVDDILKKADSLMYSAKNSGKNKIVYELVD
jgi:diguanylate cyclase (GGDEF)-like protein